MDDATTRLIVREVVYVAVISLTIALADAKSGKGFVVGSKRTGRFLMVFAASFVVVLAVFAGVTFLFSLFQSPARVP